ncbi:MAG: hypothetical protein KGI38_03930 [Thaumarchaeota archaeon]|nr:hypothetical protein [Nitrososphaerota archaeon]
MSGDRVIEVPLLNPTTPEEHSPEGATTPIPRAHPCGRVKTGVRVSIFVLCECQVVKAAEAPPSPQP